MSIRKGGAMLERQGAEQISESKVCKTDTELVKPKSKRRYLTVAVIVGVVVLICVGAALWLKLGNLGRVIVGYTYSNWAWGFTYDGTLITDTGRVCKVDLDNEQKSAFMDASDAGLAKTSDFLLSHAHCYGMVSSDDSLRIKELAGKIDENNLVTDGIVAHTFDAGSTCVSTWNYITGRIYDLNCTGDKIGSNPSDEAQELIRIIDKYLVE